MQLELQDVTSSNKERDQSKSKLTDSTQFVYLDPTFCLVKLTFAATKFNDFQGQRQGMFKIIQML